MILKNRGVLDSLSTLMNSTLENLASESEIKRNINLNVLESELVSSKLNKELSQDKDIVNYLTKSKAILKDIEKNEINKVKAELLGFDVEVTEDKTNV